MLFSSLHSRIVIFFAMLLMLVQIIAFFLINTTSLEIAKRQNIQELKTGNRIFQQLLVQNRQRLIETTALLSADFGFRKAVASNDTETILSALTNHGSRIKADMMLLASLDNILLADTLHPIGFPGQSPLTGLIQTAEKTGDASAVLIIDKQAYQVVLVPVLAPDPIAWVAVGFLVDNNLARQLREVTNLHVSFLNKSGNNHWTLLASTQPAALSQRLLKIADHGFTANHTISETIVTDDYATLFSVLQQEQGYCVYTVLQRSVQDAVQPLKHLRIILVELALASLVLSLLGSSFLAKKLTYPLKMLAEVVDKIRHGDYSQTMQLHDAVQSKNLANNVAPTQEVDILRQAYIEILRLAHIDVLTELPNRALFNDRLNQMVKLAKRTSIEFSVFMIDLNRFKFINDTLGHHAGDEVISTVGKRLRNALRESDTVARLGGDEFAVLLATGSQDHVKTVANSIRQHIEQPMKIEGQLLNVGCSIGIAFYPQHGEDVVTLLRHADAAMYVAKRGGTGSEIYAAGLDDNQQQNLNLLSELRQAVEKNEFELYYQPQLDLLTAKVVAVEALIRWRHPVRGLLAPEYFIAFAEGSGLIWQITQWVINTAIRQCGLWLSQGPSLTVSVNISAQDFADPKLAVFIGQVLQAQQVPAHMVCLEIAEGSFFKNPDRVMETLRQLSKLGVSIAIDNYGAGNSSLAHIKLLPVMGLKIDSSFIKNIILNQEDRSIVRFTLALAHELGFKVVAVGVEQEGELTLLQQLGCDYAQGYLISKPLSADQLKLWLDTSVWWGTPELRAVTKTVNASVLAID